MEGVQGKCAGQGGTPVFLCEADVWLQQDPLSWPAEERESAAPASWIRQFTAWGILYGMMLIG